MTDEERAAARARAAAALRALAVDLEARQYEHACPELERDAFALAAFWRRLQGNE